MMKFCCKCLPKKTPLSDFLKKESKLHPVPQTPGALLSLPAILLLLSGIIAFWNEMDITDMSPNCVHPKKNVERCSFSRKTHEKLLKKNILSHKMNFLSLFLDVFLCWPVSSMIPLLPTCSCWMVRSASESVVHSEEMDSQPILKVCHMSRGGSNIIPTPCLGTNWMAKGDGHVEHPCSFSIRWRSGGWSRVRSALFWWSKPCETVCNRSQWRCKAVPMGGAQKVSLG